MPGRIRMLVVLMLAAAAVLPAAAPARAKKAPPRLIEAKDSGVIPLTPSGDSATARVGIRFPAKSKGPLTLTAINARTGTDRRPSLTGQFSATPALPANRPVAIDVKASGRGDLRPGSYTVTFLAQRGKKTGHLTLRLQLPAATVAVKPRLRFHQVQHVPLIGGKADFSGQPRLVVAPGTALTGIQLTVLRQPPGGRLVLKTASSIPAGGTRPVTATLEDGAVGAHRGRVEIRADQLVKPLVVPYRVTVRRDGWWIVLMLVAGFLTGLILRKGLEQLRHRLHALRAGYAFQRELAQARAGAKDEPFRTALQSADDALRHKLGWYATASHVTDAVKLAKTEWTTARDDYARRHAEQTDALERATKTVPEGSGIDDVDAPVRAAVALFDKAAADLANADPTTAAHDLKGVPVALGDVERAAETWASAVDDVLSKLEVTKVINLEILQPQIDAARDALKPITLGGTPAPMLAAVHAAIAPVRYALRQAARQLTQVKSAFPDDGERFDDARAALAADLDAVDNLRAMVDRLDALPAPDASGKLAALKRATAAAVIDGGTAPKVPARPPRPAAPDPERPAMAHVPDVVISVGSGLATLASGIVGVVRLVVLTVVFAVVGWVTFHEHFVGTTAELAGIFLWAFSTDVTTAWVTDRAATIGGALADPKPKAKPKAAAEPKPAAPAEPTPTADPPATTP